MTFTFAKMSAKLVVHKFDSGIDFKSLQITFEEGDNGTCETRYSDWLDCKNQQRKKDREKSSRLVVKIVSGNEHSDLDLDSCAYEVEPETYTNGASQKSFARTENSETAFQGLVDGKYQFEDYIVFNVDKKAPGNITCAQDDSSTNNSTTSSDKMSPLEYSLEKVKENNARIMENIHMLNRTLHYTKKKEILDAVCPKSMRYSCNTCGKCFVYETGLKKHYSMRHALSDLQPRWQVVWTCIECFQVWPRQDLAINHSIQCCKTNNADGVREIKTSLLLQCEFCEKVYTSIPRLLRHSKIHTTASNYECNACESIFTSYKAAEQHWLLCPWLKMCYNFSLSKMLLCNACDRKFKNYEQLYIHRYKVGHFMTKPHCNKSGVKSLGVLVYQCEHCGMWFPVLQQLQTHSSQHHSGYHLGNILMNNKIDNNQPNDFMDYQNVCYEHELRHIDDIDSNMQFYENI